MFSALLPTLFRAAPVSGNMVAGPADAATLDANLDRILTLLQQASTARASVHEATVNILQSRHELSSSGAMLSAATRAAMGKRGVSQLEQAKGVLDMLTDTATLVRQDAQALQDEVHAVLSARDAAISAAESAEQARQETCERVEAEGAASVVATNELATRAQQAAASATARAEAAELRAEQAERSFVEAERERTKAAELLSAATESRDASATRLASVETQLAREREVLAKVMSENVLFVKKLEFAESERQKALAEKEAMRLEWRQQTEGWFHEAAGQLQQKLLADWGAADSLQAELAVSRQERARADAAHAVQLDGLGRSEASLREEAQSLAVERQALNSERDELRDKLEATRAQLKAAQHAGQQLIVQAEVRSQQIDELKQEQAANRSREQARNEEQLAMQAARQKEEQELASLRAALEASQSQAKLTARVNERVRAEAAEEHSRLLEALARLDGLQEQYDLLLRQNSVLVTTAHSLAAA